MNSITLTKDELYNLLNKAQVEHHKKVGDAQDDWAKWYTDYIFQSITQKEARNKLHHDFKDFYGEPDAYDSK